MTGEKTLIHYRKYPLGYSEYVFAQGAKARRNADGLRGSSKKRIRIFRRFFEAHVPYMNKGKVLCLGARTGCEVIAAIRMGFKGSVGIDIHPLNEFVIKGDWHKMPFEDESFENVFTNSLDHCYDFPKLASEIFRVLGPDGKFIFETDIRYALSCRKRQWSMDELMQRHGLNSMFWDSVDDLIDVLLHAGFWLFKKPVNRNPKKCSFVLQKG